MNILQQLRDAAGKLNPAEVRDDADRDVTVRLKSTTEPGYEAMFHYLIPDSLSADRRRKVGRLLYLDGEPNPPKSVALTLVEHGIPADPEDFVFRRGREKELTAEILEARPKLAVALARNFSPFREEYSRSLVRKTSTENALFALATALPNIAPFLGLIWSPGEFASSTALLTLNQIRMIFLLGAANDRKVGYREQKSEIATVITGAFGWRAIARELVGKIPAGGGLIPKAAIAYAGTWVVGSSVERFYRLGYGYTRSERSAAYSQAYEQGKEIVQSFLQAVRRIKNR
jgi:uncharacterized protein (DUF697 family)